jgi:hypothetical protein
MGLDGAWSFHPYLAARLRMPEGFVPGPPPPPRRRARRAAVAALRAVASLALLLAR